MECSIGACWLILSCSLAQRFGMATDILRHLHIVAIHYRFSQKTLFVSIPV